MDVDLHLPDKALALFKPARYKVLYGGRGSAKSWAIARALIARAAAQPTRVLCAREFQNSIDESVLRLLADQINALGLDALFTVQRTAILGRNGSEFAFTGLRNNTTKIKSYEGFDICWVEEAQAVSKHSWDILAPTIRKPGSEIWVSFNPELEIDETYVRFCKQPPADAIVIEMSYHDNPWFPPELEAERIDCLARDPQGYRTIWDGQCRRVVEGAIYGDELDTTRDEGRITTVPVDPSLPVHTAWDLGVLDATAIWFYQSLRGGDVRIVDYYEACDEGLPHYVQMLQRKGYTYGRHYAPHDIQVREFSSGRSRYETALNLGIRFDVVPLHEIEDGIHAVKMLFPRLWFDETKTRAGLQVLSRYRKRFNTSLAEFTGSPVHDAASHGADALRYLAISLQEPATRRAQRSESVGAMGWMG